MNLATHQETCTTLRQPDDKWVTTSQAASVLSIGEDGFTKIFGPRNGYCGVRRILRGSAGKLSARGQGQLFYIDDLREICRIRRHIASATAVAARVFAAQQKGLI